MNIELNLNCGYIAVEKIKAGNSDIFFSGKIWNINNHLSLIDDSANINDWSKIVSDLTGFYSIIKMHGNDLFAAVDQTRSRPLFYSIIKDSFYLSPSAEWIRSKTNNKVMDEESKEEFKMLGYVLGNKTLYPLVKQLQAGECLAVVNGVLEVKQYYVFKHIEPDKFEKESFFKELDIASENSIKRLIEYAGGKQIVVPLSGGYDSRLIVSLLRKLKYENVICFSYGVPENKESVFSRKIAQDLGYKWLFIEYTDNFWKEAWSSSEASEFRNYASNHTSLPHIQDWLALSKLRTNPIIKNDAVFVPGHCCVTGYIPEAIQHKKINNEFYYENVVRTHFTGRPFSLNKILNTIRLKKVLLKDIEINDKHDAASELMRFNWQERQSKYITNSVRVYESFGFDWWLPLWDQEFSKTWESVPLQGRINRVLYIEYVNKCFDFVRKSTFYTYDNASNKSWFYIFSRNLLRNISPDIIYNFFKIINNKITYEKHFLSFESLLTAEDMSFYVNNGYTLIGMYSDLFLKNRWGRFD